MLINRHWTIAQRAMIGRSLLNIRLEEDNVATTKSKKVIRTTLEKQHEGEVCNCGL